MRSVEAYESACGFIDASNVNNWRLLHLNAPAIELLGGIWVVAARIQSGLDVHSPNACSSSDVWLCDICASGLLDASCTVGSAVMLRSLMALLQLSLLGVAASHAGVGAAALFPAGIDWTGSYDELAKLDEGRHMAAFEGMPLQQVLGVDMSLAVSQQSQAD
jgi:hypothetical protein